MHNCDYCIEEFPNENSYLQHLKAEHSEELSRIDKKRVENMSTSIANGFNFNLTYGIITVLIIGFLGLLGLAVSSMGGGGGTETTAAGGEVQQPNGVGTVHYHGPISVSIGGNTINFAKSEYQLQAEAFHFEGGNGQTWHVHAQGVTLEYAMQTVGIIINENGNVIKFHNETYNASNPNTTVQVLVNGQTVDPDTYVLQKDDEIRIVAEK